MQVVILAGGYGSRLSDEISSAPKPMTLIGNRPIIWHIMKYYSSYGHNDFVILAGFKSNQIKDYFLNYKRSFGDFTINTSSGCVDYFNTENLEDWNVTILDTGIETMTAGRIKKAAPLLNNTFHLTYGDGLSNVNLNLLESQHSQAKSEVTITVVHQPGRFGMISMVNSQVYSFQEKANNAHDWINGGFMVMEKSILSKIEGSHTVLEKDVLPKLAYESKLGAFAHEGFWLPMDTPRDKNELNALWANGDAPWKIW